MAQWRRERQTPEVHLIVDGAPAAACQQDRDALGPTIWDTKTVAADVCRTCSRRLIEAAHEAEVTLAAAVQDRRPASQEPAKNALRYLARMVPAGVDADLVVYARACVVRGDPQDALTSVQRWHDNMRSIGLFAE